MQKPFYPKILIIGESLHRLTGTGITLSNLFARWPNENIAILSGKNIWWSDTNMSSSFFIWKTKLSSLHENLTNLFHVKGSVITRGKIEADEILSWQSKNWTKNINNEIASKGFQKTKPLQSTLKFLNNLFTSFIKVLGLDPYFQQIVITNSLTKWYQSYNPDIIITFLNNSPQFRLVLFLNKTYNVPIVIYPTDDHIKQMSSRSILYYFWKYKINKDYNSLLRIASCRLSICDYMSKEYKKRYNLDFSAYHNPIETEKWLPFTKTNWSLKGNFKILYMGRLGFDNTPLLHLLAQVIDELNDIGYKIHFELRLGILTDSKAMKEFNKYRYTQMLDYVPHNEMHKVLSSYDLLYFPLGFDKKTIKIYSVSMSTKISEYMISGTPILVHAPKKTAYYEYAKSEKWGYLLDNNAQSELKKAILKLLDDELLRKSLGERAIKIALKNHDATIVREKFRLEIVKATKKNAALAALHDLQ